MQKSTWERVLNERSERSVKVLSLFEGEGLSTLQGHTVLRMWNGRVTFLVLCQNRQLLHDRTQVSVT